jgi:hypothetical protein
MTWPGRSTDSLRDVPKCPAGDDETLRVHPMSPPREIGWPADPQLWQLSNV